MKLLDQYGDPIDTEALKQPVLTSRLSSVSNQFGSITTGLNPARMARILKGASEGNANDYLTMAEEIEEKDPHYMAVLGTRKRAVSQLEITVEAASDAAADKRNADLIREFLDRDQLEDEIFDLMDAVGKGYSVLEIDWDTSGDAWMPRALEWCDPRNFAFADDGKTLQLWDDAARKYIALTPYKFIAHSHKAKSGLAIRGGVARPCAWMYLFKNFSIKDWLVFCERYGQPVRIGRYEASASQTDRDVLMRAVASIGSDAAAIIPKSMEIQFVEAAKSSKDSSGMYESFARFCDEQMSKAVLGQTTTTDAIAGGHAVSQEHNKVRGDIERADARQVASTLNAQLVKPMVELNYGVQRSYPRIRIGRPEEEDTQMLAETAERAVRIGVKVSQTKLRDRLGLPAPDNDDDVLALSGPAPSNGTAASMQSATAASALHAVCAPAGPDAIDTLADDVLDGYEVLIEPTIEQIESVLKEASSWDDAFKKLEALAPDLTVSDLAEMLGRAMQTVHAAGASGTNISTPEQ